MPAVEAGQHEECGAERARLEGEALLEELSELVDLAADEGHTQEGGGEQPDAQSSFVAPLDGREGQHHGQRAHQEHEGAHRGEGNVVDVPRAGPVVQMRVEQQVRGDQGSEEHALGAEERPHRQLAVVDAEGGCVLLGVRLCLYGHLDPPHDASGSNTQP